MELTAEENAKDKKPEFKKLSIGFITPNIESYKRFKKNNPQHDVFIIDDSQAIFGLYLDTIIKGDDWEKVNKVVVENAYLRIKKYNNV